MLWEKAAHKAERGKLTEHAARKVISEIYALSHDDILPNASAEEFLNAWVQRKEIETAAGTARKYRDVVTQFLEFLGDQKRNDVSRVTTKTIAAFRDQMSKRLSIGSTNIALKILRVAFTQAKREGYCSENPAEAVPIIKRREEKTERRPFTLPELKRILAVANEEWKGLILFGLYSGQRLKDLASLTWQNLDLERQELRLVTSKTGRRQILPLATPLLRHIECIGAGDNPQQPLFPKLSATLGKTGRSGHLSNQFYQILVAAGLAAARTHERTGKGRSSRREANELSFHCLRHTATSLMKNAGISPAIVQEFIGHDSPAISANYTHIELESLRKAAESLPDLLSK
jgi:integrase